jgi:S1-C subfamily serine protease
LKDDDVIVRYQGEAVESALQLRRLVRETPPGREVALDVQRGGQAQKLTARLGESPSGPRVFAFGDFDFAPPEPPEPPAAPRAPRAPRAFAFNWGDSLGDDIVEQMLGGRRGKLGLRYQELDEQLAQYFKVPEGSLLVVHVDADGPAAKAGVKAGDVLQKLNGKALRRSADLRNEVRDLEAGSEATLTVQREGRAMDVKVTVGGTERTWPRARRRPV